MIGLNILAFTPFDPWHMLVLGLVALLLFGKRLPDVGRSLGKGIAEFKKGLSDVQNELNRDDKKDQPKARLQAPEEEPPARTIASGDEPEQEDPPQQHPNETH